MERYIKFALLTMAKEFTADLIQELFTPIFLLRDIMKYYDVCPLSGEFSTSVGISNWSEIYGNLRHLVWLSALHALTRERLVDCVTPIHT